MSQRSTLNAFCERGIDSVHIPPARNLGALGMFYRSMSLSLSVVNAHFLKAVILAERLWRSVAGENKCEGKEASMPGQCKSAEISSAQLSYPNSSSEKPIAPFPARQLTRQCKKRGQRRKTWKR